MTDQQEKPAQLIPYGHILVIGNKNGQAFQQNFEFPDMRSFLDCLNVLVMITATAQKIVDVKHQLAFVEVRGYDVHFEYMDEKQMKAIHQGEIETEPGTETQSGIEIVPG